MISVFSKISNNCLYGSPVKYDPKAPQPTHWLRFLSDLLYPEDIPTVQEFIGYRQS